MKFEIEATIHLHVHEDAGVLHKLDRILTAVKPLEKQMTDLELAFADLSAKTDALVVQNDALVALTDAIKVSLDALVAAGGGTGTVTVAAVQAVVDKLVSATAKDTATIVKDTPVKV